MYATSDREPSVTVENFHSIYDASRQLARAIQEQYLDKGNTLDRMLTLGLTGGHIGNVVARELGFDRKQVFNGVAEPDVDDDSGKLLGFHFGQMPSPSDVNHQKILVLDGVYRSGRKLAAVTNYLHACNALEVHTGVLYYAGNSSQSTAPDWFVARTDDIIKMPWDTSK